MNEPDRTRRALTTSTPLTLAATSLHHLAPIAPSASHLPQGTPRPSQLRLIIHHSRYTIRNSKRYRASAPLLVCLVSLASHPLSNINIRHINININIHILQSRLDKPGGMWVWRFLISVQYFLFSFGLETVTNTTRICSDEKGHTAGFP